MTDCIKINQREKNPTVMEANRNINCYTILKRTRVQISVISENFSWKLGSRNL